MSSIVYVNSLVVIVFSYVCCGRLKICIYVVLSVVMSLKNMNMNILFRL